MHFSMYSGILIVTDSSQKFLEKVARHLSWLDVDKRGLDADKTRQNSPNYNGRASRKVDPCHRSGAKWVSNAF